MPGRRPLSPLSVLLSLLLLIVTGCTMASPPLAEISAPEAEGQALLAMWLERNEALQSLQGLARVKVKTAQESVSGTQVVVAARPNRLRAETLSPFGLPLLSLTSDGRKLAVLLPGDNLYYTGAATTANLMRFTRMPLSATALIDILFGQPPLLPFRELTTFRTAAGGWRLLLTADSRRQELVFDAAVRLEQARYYSGDSLRLTVDYADYADSALLPRQIHLEQPPFAMQASLDFRELTVNQPLPPGHFSQQPPPGSRIISLDQPGDDDASSVTSELPFEGGR